MHNISSSLLHRSSFECCCFSSDFYRLKNLWIILLSSYSIDAVSFTKAVPYNSTLLALVLYRVRIVFSGRSTSKNDCEIVAAHAVLHFNSSSLFAFLANPRPDIDISRYFASLTIFRGFPASVNWCTVSAGLSVTTEHFVGFHSKWFLASQIVQASSNHFISASELATKITSSATSFPGSRMLPSFVVLSLAMASLRSPARSSIRKRNMAGEAVPP